MSFQRCTGERISDDAEAYLAEILSTPPEQFSASYLLVHAFELSLQSRTSIYDCLYLALSDDQNCPMVTADTKLINKLGDPPNIIHISDF